MDRCTVQQTLGTLYGRVASKKNVRESSHARASLDIGGCTMASARSRAESSSLEAILDGTIEEFFENVWQRSCSLQGRSIEPALEPSLFRTPSQLEIEDDSNPYLELVRHGWSVLLDLIERAQAESENADGWSEKTAIVFRNRAALPPPEQQACYGSSLFAAFLDGCSIVVNHADLYSPHIALLCHDLQRSFPHAYANAYITPPSSQAVPPHADDRDVLVIQVYGSKRWKVYSHIPIPYPYSHEQVGKDNLPIPPHVLQGPLLIDHVLQPGQVLYLPRGYVHEATANNENCSFHVTVALATHDWSLAGLVASQTERVLTNQVDYRKAVPREVLDDSPNEWLEQQLQQVWERLQTEVTAATVQQQYRDNMARHNQRALALRTKLLQEETSLQSKRPAGSRPVTGPAAARRVTLESTIRAARESEQPPPTESPRGLNVRPESYDALIGILQSIKGTPQQTYRVRDLLECDGVVCRLTMLCFVKRCVELGAFALVEESA